MKRHRLPLGGVCLHNNAKRRAASLALAGIVRLCPHGFVFGARPEGDFGQNAKAGAFGYCADELRGRAARGGKPAFITIFRSRARAVKRRGSGISSGVTAHIAGGKISGIRRLPNITRTRGGGYSQKKRTILISRGAISKAGRRGRPLPERESPLFRPRAILQAPLLRL